jgi:antitoxin component YwqK of YwqJK toxin-antitoxin module
MRLLWHCDRHDTIDAMRVRRLQFLSLGWLMLCLAVFRLDIANAQSRQSASDIQDQIAGQQNVPTRQLRNSPSFSTPELAKKALKSLVIVITQDNSGNVVSLGSGFFITPDLVATNLHVLKMASQVIIKSSSDGKSRPAENVVAFSLVHDVCVLSVPGAEGTSIQVSGTPVRVGDEILVAGNPEGLEATISKGIVSAIRNEEHLIQIDAPISHGSSGGPVVNQRGEVVGLAVSSFVRGQNLNFAVPAHYLADETVENVVSVATAGHLAMTDREMEGFTGPTRGYSEKRVEFRFDAKAGTSVELPAIMVNAERFNEAGEVEEIDHFKDGKPNGKTLFIYSDKGLIRKRTKVSESGITEVKDYSTSEGIVAQIASIHYDETRAVGKDTDLKFHRIVYDPQGNEIEWDFPNSGTKNVYSYDGKGRIKEASIYRNDELVSRRRVTYVTNEYGDWIQWKAFKSDLRTGGREFRPFLSMYREITY